MDISIERAEQEVLAVAIQRLGQGTVTDVKIDERPDFEGDETLFVTVVIADTQTIENAGALLDVMVSARDRLDDLGEPRFPVISFVLAAEYDKPAAA